MKRVLVAILAATAVLVSAGASTAGVTPADVAAADENPLKFGVQASYAEDFEFGLGPRVEYSLESAGVPISIVGSFDYFFPGGDVNFWELNLNALYSVPTDAASIYAGGGLNYGHWEKEVLGVGLDDNEFGLNVLGGAQFDIGQIFKPFVEFRLVLDGFEDFAITGGVLF